MSARLEAKFAPAFSRDLKRKARKREWDLAELEAVIGLILENSTESIEILKHRHNMHRLSGRWEGSNECHVANAGPSQRRDRRFRSGCSERSNFDI